MLTDVWPLYGLTIDTPRVQLRVPREEGLAELAELAGRGVHQPGERPFLTPWTEGSAEERSRSVLQGHWDRLGSWEVEDWRLGLGIFEGGRPVGAITLRANDFPAVREVSTASWLGVPNHGQGLGTEARGAVLTLAFDPLGAEAALSEVFQDNAGSQGVSRKLGYEKDGISRDARGDEVLVSDRLRLTRDRWQSRQQSRQRPEWPECRVEGLEACRSFFGV